MKRHEPSHDDLTSENRTHPDTLMNEYSVYQTGMMLLTVIDEHFSSEVADKRIALWGASNDKGEVDESVCLVIDWLVEFGARVSVHDCTAVEKVEERLGKPGIEYPLRQWDAVKGADALIIASLLPQYCHIDAGRLCWSVNQQTLFDVHASVDRESLQYSGFLHYTLDGEIESLMPGTSLRHRTMTETARNGPGRWARGAPLRIHQLSEW